MSSIPPWFGRISRLYWALATSALLALAGCGLPEQAAQSIPTSSPLAPPTAELIHSPGAPPVPDIAIPAAQTSAALPATTPTMPPTPSTTRSTSQTALPRLVFRADGLYTIDADGANLTRLTTHPQDQLPAWSPDGQRIAFASDRTSTNMDIFVINTDGTGLTQLTSDQAMDNFPTWSPDGQYIAFTSNRDPSTPYGDIYIMRFDGTQVQRVTTDPTFENIIGWSPDNTHIFYSINHDGSWTIHRIDLDGSQDATIVAGAAGVISLDGTTLTFTRTEYGQDDVWISAVDGTNVRRITNSPSLEYSLAWSPDAKRIAFNPGLFVVNADGTGRAQLSDPQVSTGEIHWSPEGRYIAFQSNNTDNQIDLAVVDVATGVRTLLTRNMSVEAGFAWSP
jgi:TolB protein